MIITQVAADLFLADLAKPDGKGTAIWSTHKSSGFLFSATSGPQPFTYEAGVGGVVTGWEDGVMSMALGEKAKLGECIIGFLTFHTYLSTLI